VSFVVVVVDSVVDSTLNPARLLSELAKERADDGASNMRVENYIGIIIIISSRSERHKVHINIQAGLGSLVSMIDPSREMFGISYSSRRECVTKGCRKPASISLRTARRSLSM
jgi:hypothetical protein